MMRRSRQPLLRLAGAATLLVSTLAGSLACADDAPPPVGWSGKGEAGLVLARGNADTTTANVRLDASDVIGQWKHTTHLAFLYGENAAFSTAQRLEGSWQADYNFGQRTFVFGSINGEQDRFDGFVYQEPLPAVSATGSSTPTPPSSRGDSASAIGACNPSSS